MIINRNNVNAKQLPEASQRSRISKDRSRHSDRIKLYLPANYNSITSSPYSSLAPKYPS